MTFSEIIPFMNEGFAVRRAEYDPALIIFKQVPASIDDVSNMRSIPKQVKDLLLSFKVGIDYESHIRYVINTSGNLFKNY